MAVGSRPPLTETAGSAAARFLHGRRRRDREGLLGARPAGPWNHRDNQLRRRSPDPGSARGTRTAWRASGREVRFLRVLPWLDQNISTQFRGADPDDLCPAELKPLKFLTTQ